MTTPRTLPEPLVQLRAELTSAKAEKDMPRFRELVHRQVELLKTLQDIDPLTILEAHAWLFQLSPEAMDAELDTALAAASRSDDPVAPMFLDQIAHAAARASRRRQAERVWNAAIEHRTKLLAADAESMPLRGELGESLIDLGFVLADEFFNPPYDEQLAARAEVALRRGIRLWEQVTPEEALVNPKTRLAFMLCQQNRYGEGVPLLEEACAHAEASWGPDDPLTAKCLANAGAMLLEGRSFHERPLADAAAYLTRAAAVFEADDPEGQLDDVRRMLAQSRTS